jgi:hypothetical protein
MPRQAVNPSARLDPTVGSLLVLTDPQQKPGGSAARGIQPSDAERLPPELPNVSRDVVVQAETAPPAPAVAVTARKPASPETAAVVAGETIKRHSTPRDMVAMLPKTAATVDLPESNPGRPAAPRVDSGPRQPMPAKETQESHVAVNIPELAARIAGNNLALHTLEAELDEKREWSVDHLDGLLNRLDILALRQRDLAMFRDLLTAEEQTHLERIAPTQQAIGQMAARISELRNRAKGEGFTGTDPERQEGLKQLDELSQRLSEMAAEK